MSLVDAFRGGWRRTRTGGLASAAVVFGLACGNDGVVIGQGGGAGEGGQSGNGSGNCHLDLPPAYCPATFEDTCDGRHASKIMEQLAGFFSVADIAYEAGNRCAAIVVALGGSSTEVTTPQTDLIRYGEDWCAAASSRLVAAQANIAVWPSPCVIDVELLGSCEAACTGQGASCESSLATRCPEGQTAGICSGQCAGGCLAIEAPVACDGMCSGVCNGSCNGIAMPEPGGCSGTCSGLCQGECISPAGAVVQCQGLCEGLCSVEFGTLGRGCTDDPIAAAPSCATCAGCTRACGRSARLAQTCYPSSVAVELPGGTRATEVALEREVGAFLSLRSRMQVFNKELAGYAQELIDGSISDRCVLEQVQCYMPTIIDSAQRTTQLLSEL